VIELSGEASVDDGPDSVDDPRARVAVHALTRASRILERTLCARDIEGTAVLSLADFRVLATIGAGEARASRLAARLAVGKPTISSTVDSLVRRGFVRREAHGADQRAVDLALTADGDAMLEAAESGLAGVVLDLVSRTEHPEAVLAALADLGGAIEARQASIAAARRAAGGANAARAPRRRESAADDGEAR